MPHDGALEIAKDLPYKMGPREVQYRYHPYPDKVGIDWYMGPFKRVRDELPRYTYKAMTGARG